MQSKIEQLIDEIEEYIASCKPQTFSKDNIIVDRYHMEELLEDLKKSTPEEIRRYQKITAQKDAIIEDAQSKANELLQKVAHQSNELVSEHEIMQKAHASAQEVMNMAQLKAQKIVDDATVQANDLRQKATEYTDGLLGSIHNLLYHSIETSSGHYDKLISSLSQYADTVALNRAELHPIDAQIDMGIPAKGNREDEISIM